MQECYYFFLKCLDKYLPSLKNQALTCWVLFIIVVVVVSHVRLFFIYTWLPFDVGVVDAFWSVSSIFSEPLFFWASESSTSRKLREKVLLPGN